MVEHIKITDFVDRRDGRKGRDAPKNPTPPKQLYHTTRDIDGIEEENMVLPASKVGGNTGIWLSDIPAFTQDRKYAVEIIVDQLDQDMLEEGGQYRNERSKEIGRWGKWYVYRDIIPLDDVERILFWTGEDPHEKPLKEVAEEVEIHGRDATKPDVDIKEDASAEMSAYSEGDKVKYMGKRWTITDREEAEFSDKIRYDIEDINNPDNIREGIPEKHLEDTPNG